MIDAASTKDANRDPRAKYAITAWVQASGLNFLIIVLLLSSPVATGWLAVGLTLTVLALITFQWRQTHSHRTWISTTTKERGVGHRSGQTCR